MSHIRANRFKIVAVCGAILLFAFILALWLVFAPLHDVQAAILLQDLPAHEWYVCRDLGIGSVPGVPDPRQRLKLCHPKGWVIYTYCLQPGVPAPPLGTICDRVGENTFVCGGGYQWLQLYAMIATPAPTGTATAVPTTPVPTATGTLIPTPTPARPTTVPTPRTVPGGSSSRGPFGQILGVQILVLTNVIMIAAFVTWRAFRSE